MPDNRYRFLDENDNNNNDDDGREISLFADRCFDNHRVTRMERNRTPTSSVSRQQVSNAGEREADAEGSAAISREGEEENRQ